MNYLAHIYLSGEQPHMKVGGLLGDFIKGPLSTQQPFYQGMLLHRRIDNYVDNLAPIKAALTSLPPPHRRFGGILLDILFDHFLASEWSQLHSEPLESFCRDFYQQLNQYYEQLPDGARRFAQLAPQTGWLQSYQNFDNLSPILARVGQRLRRPVALEQAVPLLEERYDDLFNTFQASFPQIEQFAEQQRASILSTTA